MELAKGVHDVPPSQKMLRNLITDTLRSVFELYSFMPLETPILERLDTLTAKYAGGSEILREVFKLTDQGERKLGLRFDLTVPFARFISMNPQLKMPFKRYQIGKVFRDGPIKAGRVREFYQCDVDIAGNTGAIAEAELISLAATAFGVLNIPYTIKLNSAKILTSMAKAAGAENLRDKAVLSLDKIDKIGRVAVEKEMEENGLGKDSINKFMEYALIDGSNEEILNKLAEIDEEGTKELKEIITLTDNPNIKITPSLARGLTYYTGSVFEIFTEKISSSIAAGGRYSKMIKEFCGRDISATGISFGLEPISHVLKEDMPSSPAEVFIIPIKTIKESYKLAAHLREEGFNTDIDLLERGPSKNLDYAAELGIPFVVFLGQKEIEEKKVKIRDMESGEEKMLSMDELIDYLNDRFD